MVVRGVNSTDQIVMKSEITGSWVTEAGMVSQVSVGNLGVFGVNAGYEVFHCKGTYKNPFAKGSWEKISGQELKKNDVNPKKFKSLKFVRQNFHKYETKFRLVYKM